MQKKTSGISPFLLVLMQIGLILTLLVWWGLLGKFLLPAVIQGQADWGKAALLPVGLVILLPVGRWSWNRSRPGCGCGFCWRRACRWC